MDRCRACSARCATAAADAGAARLGGRPDGGCAERSDDPPLSRFLFDPNIGDVEHRHTGLRGCCKSEIRNVRGSLKRLLQIAPSLAERLWIRRVRPLLQLQSQSRELSMAGDQETTSTILRFSDLETIRSALDTLAQTLPDIGHAAPISEDAPQFFDVNILAEHLDRVATEQGGNLAGFISTLGLRIRGMLADQRLGAVIGRDPPTSFETWLKDYVGDDGASNGQIAVVDLSLVPSEIVHIVVSVLARLIFESLQRYRRSHPKGQTLPTVLVLEEAHTFVRRGKDDDGPASSPTQLCREVFRAYSPRGTQVRAWASAFVTAPIGAFSDGARPMQHVSIAPHRQ